MPRHLMRMRPLVGIAAAVLAAPLGAQAALPRSTPERQGISSSALLAFVEEADSTVDALHSFMLVRHGSVIAEGWWSPYDSQTPHMLYSLSKSFTSTAVGLAVAEGKLSVDDQVLKFFPEDAPAQPSANLQAMRVRDLLRMNTGQDAEAKLWPWYDQPTGGAEDTSWTKTFLAQPVPFKPGTRFLYNSPATFMLSAIVQKVTGMTVLDYLRPRLFEPLGIANPVWPHNPQGITVGGVGLLIRTEDIARFGQLYLQRGQWNGRQLIPATWVAEATAMQTANGSSPSSDWDQGYGYQFWRSRHNSYRGDGAFGQYCLVLPEVDAVVVITSGLRDMQAVMNLVWDKLLPAMQAQALPEDSPAQRRLAAKLAGLTLRPARGDAVSPLARRTSRRWYQFPENDRGLEAVALDLSSRSPALLVRTREGETRTPFRFGAWEKSRDAFTARLDHMLTVPAHPLIASSGAWTADSVFTVKLALYETPYAATLRLQFDGDRLVLDTEYNVSFGPTKQPQLIGQATR
jgi:CubicO group peptidase (beta-lactamase class C family)